MLCEFYPCWGQFFYEQQQPDSGYLLKSYFTTSICNLHSSIMLLEDLCWQNFVHIYFLINYSGYTCIEVMV